MAAMRSGLPPWMFGEEKERMDRYRTERAELLLQGHDPDAIMDRWEDEQERRKISSGRRVRCVVEEHGGVFYVRKVVEDVEEITKGDEKETANGGAPAAAGQISEGKGESGGEEQAGAVAAGQAGEEKEAANGDAPTGAQIREMQGAETSSVDLSASNNASYLG